MITEVLRSRSVTEMHESAASLFVSAAVESVTARGAFTVALAGGATPKGVYSLLADDARLRAQVQWQNVFFFWSDERHVGPTHHDSNFRMAHEAMLNRLPVDPSHVCRIKGEYLSARQAAQEYEHDLRKILGLSAWQVPKLDLVMLGMGSDGHTPSLFPGSEALYEERRLVVSTWVKSNCNRITLTLPVLNNAEHVLFLVDGADKAETLKSVIDGSRGPDQLPAQLVRPLRGRVRWLVDPSASRLLSAVEHAGVPMTAASRLAEI